MISRTAADCRAAEKCPGGASRRTLGLGWRALSKTIAEIASWSEDELSAIAAVKRLDTLPREKVRAAFEARFSSKVMAANYVNVYEELLRQKRRTVLREVNAS